MNEVVLIVSYLLGLMPIYLMLARMNGTLGKLKSDHEQVEARLDKIENPGTHPVKRPA